MKNLETLRDRLKAQRNPGHEIAAFLLGHSNSIDYLIGHLEAALEALKADQEAERCFAGRLLSSVKAEAERVKEPYPQNPPWPDFALRIKEGHYDGFAGFNQFRHDVPAFFGSGGLLDDCLERHQDKPERERLTLALVDFLASDD